MENQKQRFCYVLKLFPEYYDTENWPEEASNILSVHFQYLKKLTEEGVAILVGRTVNHPMTENDFGICIFEASSRDEAQKIMENDPTIKNKIMYATLYDFSLALLRK
ncbi:MAG: YciI family protein [Ignavibacteriaceae bacterium]